jgi:hypothetical protein
LSHIEVLLQHPALRTLFIRSTHKESRPQVYVSFKKDFSRTSLLGNLHLDSVFEFADSNIVADIVGRVKALKRFCFIVRRWGTIYLQPFGPNGGQALHQLNGMRVLHCPSLDQALLTQKDTLEQLIIHDATYHWLRTYSTVLIACWSLRHMHRVQYLSGDMQALETSGEVMHSPEVRLYTETLPRNIVRLDITIEVSMQWERAYTNHWRT